MSEGYIDLNRAVDSIRVGDRIRQDYGDIDALVESIRLTGGLLQPITITPDGWLICGARRLAAVKQLAMQTISVWVRTGISTELELLLAEYHENTARKALNLVEAGRRFRELLAIKREDAERRQAATRYRADISVGSGVGNLPTPGRASDQAAAIVGFGRRTLEKVAAVLDAAEDATVDPAVREVALRQRDLMSVGDSAADPAYRAVRAAQDEAARAAVDAIARAKAARSRPSASRSQPGERVPPLDPRLLGPRAFVVMLTETDFWWLYYDEDELLARLTPANWDQVDDWYANTSAFIERLIERRRASA